MKKLLVLIALVLPPSGVTLAQEAYFGLSGNVAYVFDIETETVDTDAFTVSPGAQLGVRNLLGPFGLRLTGEYSVNPSSGFLEVGGDLLFNVGTVIDPYVGIGVGLAGQGDASLGMARLFGGLAPRFGPAFGLFGEASLNAYSDGVSEAFAVKARGGINVFF